VLIGCLFVAGAIGAVSRYLADGWIQARASGPLPWGTFVINVAGSFILGLVSGLAQYHGLGPLPTTVVGIGFCGAFTTFSTFSYESVRLLERGDVTQAATNTIGSVVIGLAAAGLALALVAAL
jgi:fluoride exporter